MYFFQGSRLNVCFKRRPVVFSFKFVSKDSSPVFLITHGHNAPARVKRVVQEAQEGSENSKQGNTVRGFPADRTKIQSRKLHLGVLCHLRIKVTQARRPLESSSNHC